MKELKDAINEVRNGSILTINKNILNQKEPTYDSCLIVYDGDILVDVKGVELGDFLSQLPNIKKQLDNGYIHKISYNDEEGIYQSAIIKSLIDSECKKNHQEKPVNDFLTLSEDILNSIIDLDKKIANSYKKGKSLVKKAMRA